MESLGVAEPDQGWQYSEQGQLRCEPSAQPWELVQQQRTGM